MQKREPSVFLSYSREDRDVVLRIGDRLKAARIQVWLDRELVGGSTWIEEIERYLSAVDFVVFLISPGSVRSTWARQELQVALHRQVSREGGAVIVPVILEDTDNADVPPLLRQYNWIDLRGGNFDEGVRALVAAIHGSGTRYSLYQYRDLMGVPPPRVQ
jgi:hypothetical protein